MILRAFEELVISRENKNTKTQNVKIRLLGQIQNELLMFYRVMK